MAPHGWRLVARFEGVECPSPMMTTEDCPCRFCWCDKCEIQRLPATVLRSFFSAQKLELLKEIMELENTTQPNLEKGAVFLAVSTDEGIEDEDSAVNGRSQGKSGSADSEVLNQHSSERLEPDTSNPVDSGVRSDGDGYQFDHCSSLASHSEPADDDIELDGTKSEDSKKGDSNALSRIDEVKERKSGDPAAAPSQAPLQPKVGKPSVTSKTGKRKNKLWCSECGNSFETGQELIGHLREHDSVRPFKCGLCTTRFETKTKVNAHLRTHRNQGGNYECNHCKFSSKEASKMLQHLRIHSGEKPFSCDRCGKAFAKLVNLSAHKRIHSGERPYKCDQCEKAFIQLQHLTKHKRIHSGEQPFKCDTCTKRFRQESNLRSHQKTAHFKTPSRRVNRWKSSARTMRSNRISRIE